MWIRSLAAVLGLVLFACAAAWGGPVVGWRTDGTGRYPDATPPTTWSKTNHIVWSTPMAAPGNATPILVGDRLFCCAEPASLLCLNLPDGKLLWQKSHPYLDTLSPQELVKVQENTKAADAVLAQVEALQAQLVEAREKGGLAPQDKELQQKAAALEKQIADLQAKVKALKGYRAPHTDPTDGLTSPTPVSDGRRVFVLTGEGVAACYDLDGHRKWIRFLERPGEDSDQSASPLLVGDRLIVHTNETLRCLAADTGEPIWQVTSGGSYGSPQHARIGGVDLAVAASGEVIRISDAKVFKCGLPSLDFNSPLVVGDIVYFIQPQAQAFRLAIGDGGPGGGEAGSVGGGAVTATPLWKAKIKNGRYYASPLLHDGLIYAITEDRRFTILDAATGAKAYDKMLDLGPGTVFPSITGAGQFVFVSSDNGTTWVLRPGRTPEVLARNTLEPFRACPVFAGKRMYVRGLERLDCIGE